MGTTSLAGPKSLKVAFSGGENAAAVLEEAWLSGFGCSTRFPFRRLDIRV
jgi:hypothetical protein